MLRKIKTLHTIIWFIMASADFYILYAGITNKFNIILYISIALLLIETIILLINKWSCPLTSLAEKYTNNREDNFDIFLPNWLAKYNKLIFWFIFIVWTSLVLFNYFKL